MFRFCKLLSMAFVLTMVCLFMIYVLKRMQYIVCEHLANREFCFRWLDDEEATVVQRNGIGTLSPTNHFDTSDAEPVLRESANEEPHFVPDIFDRKLSREPALKQILLWNGFFGQPDCGLGFGTTAFRRTNCSKTCNITSDMSQLEAADAVVIHTFNVDKRHPGDSLPRRQNPRQVFVFFLLESQLRSQRGLVSMRGEYEDLFNLTFTYLADPDTDIYAPIGYTSELDSPRPGHVPSEKSMTKKTKIVFWVVSNCHSPSSREEYVKRLSRYVTVDVYGRCGNDTCHRDSTCFAHLQNVYMFYVAFENSYCQDYITEKVYRTLTLKANVVPIVLGGGNYARDLPPHSFIDVRDFNSPEALSKYLLYLKSNMTAYREYFRWKEMYAIHSLGETIRNGFCRLCEILHNGGYPYKTGYDVIRYWNPEEQCLRGDPERRAVHLIE